jgi:hypothetical protein
MPRPLPTGVAPRVLSGPLRTAPSLALARPVRDWFGSTMPGICGTIISGPRSPTM